jgi:hypothetical protein
VAVAPYYAYYSLEDLALKMEECKSKSDSKSDFLACITEQIFYSPE